MVSSFKQLKEQRAGRRAHSQSRSQTYSITQTPNEKSITSESASALAETTASSIAGPSRRFTTVEASDGKTTVIECQMYPELKQAGLEVRSSKERGRGLYVTRPMQAGTTILRVNPITSILSTSSLSTHCSACFTPASKLFRCTACRGLYYCSANCQRSDWASHKYECVALQRLRHMWASAYPDKAKNGDNGWMMNEAVRAMGRICWARKAERVGAKDPDWWSGIASMESHVEKLPEEKVMKLGNQVQHLRHYLSAADRSDTPDVLHPADMTEYGFNSVGELLDLCSAFSVNSFTLSLPDLSPIGVSTSPVVALANHACNPNAVVVFPSGPEMHLVAISDLSPGDEILTSYIDVSLPFEERQKDISERYNFICSCDLCSKSQDPTFVDSRSCVIDPKCGKRARMPGVEGVICECGEKILLNPELKSLIAKGKNLIAQDEENSLDPEAGREALSSIIPSLSKLVPPSTYPLLALLRLQSLFNPPTTVQNLKINLDALDLALTGAREVYPLNHPNIAIILAERGKLLALDPDDLEGHVGIEQNDKSGTLTVSDAGKSVPVPKMLSSKLVVEKRRQLAKAIIGLRQAVEVLDKGFGKGGGLVGQDVRNVLAGCEQEMAMLSR